MTHPPVGSIHGRRLWTWLSEVFEVLWGCCRSGRGQDCEYDHFAACCMRNRVDRRLRMLRNEIESCPVAECARRQRLVTLHQHYWHLCTELDDSTIRCGDRVLVDDPLTPGMSQRRAVVLGHLGQTLAVRLYAPPRPQDVLVASRDVLRCPSRDVLQEWQQLRTDAGVARPTGLRRGHACWS